MAMNGDGAPPEEAAVPAAALITAEELARWVDDTRWENDAESAGVHRDAAIEMVRKFLGDEDYAALPIPIANECIVRIVGHGMQSQSGAVIEDSIGPRTVKYPDDRMRSLLKRSGAEALLSPYKTRGAGIIG